MKHLFLFALSFLFISCSSQSSTNEKKECPFQNEFDNVECGIMTVPENRGNSGGATIDITYAIIKSENRLFEDPVVYLMGGPGGSAIALLEFWKDHPITRNRDLILVDQRGTKYSDGVCPDIGKEIIDLIARDLTYEQEYQLLNTVAQKCKSQMLNQGRDPSSFNTIENAQDIIQLREVLGYQEWNLYGASYGTRLALEIAIIEPSGVRSMVLASPISREQQFYKDYGSNFERSINLVFDNCKKNPHCNQKYPDLSELYLQLLDDLAEKPVTVNINGEDFTINGADLSLIVHQMLYTRQTISTIPSFLTGFKDGNKQIIESGIYPLIYLTGIVDFGMYMSTQAFDEGWYDITQSFKENETDIAEMKYGMAFHNAEVRITPEWHSTRNSDDYKLEDITIPTLIIAGEYDPVTPPSYGTQISKKLPNNYFYEIPGRGHGLLDRCSNSIMLSFLKDPDSSPESDCLENMPKISFY